MKAKYEAPQHIDVYQAITDKIIEQLEHNIVPWRKPWTESGPPCNFLTQRPYHGVNVLLLGMLDYHANWYLSWKQLKAIGGSVNKGETGHLVVFWKRLETPPKDGQFTDDDQQPYRTVLRYYKVFNVDQCNNIPLHLIPTYAERTHTPMAACDEIIEHMPQPPKIKHGKQACYDPTADVVTMPKQTSFESAESYYSTKFHELIHSTGHSSRLNRKEIVEPITFGSEFYSIEELTAEIGTTFLQSITGLGAAEFINSVSYINGWLKQLRNDKTLIIHASSQAQKAVDFMLNREPSIETVSEVQDIETQ